MAGMGALPDTWADQYAQAMTRAGRVYAPATSVVSECVGSKAYITQTGGMNLAIQAPFEGGFVLITADEDSLPWDLHRLTGWACSVFLGPDDGDLEPVAWYSAPGADHLTLRGVIATAFTILRTKDPT